MNPYLTLKQLQATPPGTVLRLGFNDINEGEFDYVHKYTQDSTVLNITEGVGLYNKEPEPTASIYSFNNPNDKFTNGIMCRGSGAERLFIIPTGENPELVPIPKEEVDQHFQEPYLSILKKGLDTYFKPNEDIKVFPVYHNQKHNDKGYTTFAILEHNPEDTELPYALGYHDFYWIGGASGDGTGHASMEEVLKDLKNHMEAGLQLMPKPPIKENLTQARQIAAAATIMGGFPLPENPLT